MKVLVVPAAESGRGGGHLVRAVELAGGLRLKNVDAWIFLAPETKAVIPVPEELLLTKAAGQAWDLVVLDKYTTRKEELDFYASLGTVLGVDEGGDAREDFDFLLDIIPGLSGKISPNWTLPSLLSLPSLTRSTAPRPSAPRLSARSPSGGRAGEPFKVLAAFGAEDSAGLTLSVARILAKTPGLKVSALAPSANPESFPEGVEVLAFVPHLKERFAEYDLVLTHFGLGAFEALHAGVPVLLVSPTAYHEKLARNAGFVSLGRAERALRVLSKIRGRPLFADYVERAEKAGGEIARRYGLDVPPALCLDGFLARFSGVAWNAADGGGPRCPACGEKRDGSHRVMGRFPDKTYRLCPRCGVIYMLRFAAHGIHYGEDYFFDDYRTHYGKTYLEDFPNLLALGTRRLSVIKKLLPPGRLSSGTRPRVLDIGCAYGPFLAAAKSEGFDCTGVEPNADAVRYVRDKLKVEVVEGFFPAVKLPPAAGGFDLISFWYVLEHFEHAGEVLDAAVKLLAPGGILAFATPSARGISARARTRLFLEQSPADHSTIWNPRSVKFLLGTYGLVPEKIVITGHHPERFPFIGRFLKDGETPAYKFFLTLSRRFQLGDTFEVYAVKKLPFKSKDAGG